MSTITIPVDLDLAEKYHAAPKPTRDWFEYQTMLRMRTMLNGPGRSIREIMDDCSNEAQRNGMTPEILEEILNEKQ